MALAESFFASGLRSRRGGAPHEVVAHVDAHRLADPSAGHEEPSVVSKPSTKASAPRPRAGYVATRASARSWSTTAARPSTSAGSAAPSLMFRDRTTATGLIRSHLEPELAAQIDWSTLRLAPSEYVDEALDDSRSDLLFEAHIGGRPGFLYLLVEHQSSADAIMPFRVVRYMVQVWDRWLDAHPGALRLPPIARSTS